MKIWEWIRNIFALIIGVVSFVFAGIVIKKYLAVSNKKKIESPLPFKRDKKNKQILYVKKDKEWLEITLPKSMENKNVKAVQINKEKSLVEVKIKHETIDYNSYTTPGDNKPLSL